MVDAPLSIRCLNCGEATPGRYCAGCGQRSDTGVPTVGSLFREAVGAFLSFDSKLWRTLRALFLRPGELTAEYMAGRRAAYVSPIQLYLWLQAGCLFLFGTIVPNGSSGHRDRAYIAMGLILAGLFRLWFGGKGRPGALHFVFALHVSALLMILSLLDSLALRVVLPAMGLRPTQGSSFGGTAVVFGVIALYTALGARRAYGEGTLGATAKTAAVIATIWAVDTLLARF